MAWTTVPTFTAGQVIAASDLNTYLRDDSNYLYSRPHFMVYMASAASIATGGAVIPYDTVFLDSNTSWNASPHWQYNIPPGEGGFWLFSVINGWAANSTGQRGVQVANDWSFMGVGGDPGNYGRQTVSAIVYTVAGDAWAVTGYQNSGGNLNTLSGINSVQFSGIRIG